MAMDPIQRPVYTTNTRPPKRGARQAVASETFDHVMQAAEQEEPGSKPRNKPEQTAREQSDHDEPSGEGHIDERI